ncbi:GNAT family N-acetyltransferase [Fulvivirga sp.]|jgi:predicted GNAT family acetyltransferase|uniref:GNAT family N-acetyltransferase n=1 Tax=Fulvivirga sp. TaxID=1931237 RepID=UPI0032EE1210
MEVQHQETENKGKFYINDGNEAIAEMTYSKAGEQKIIIDHTEVNDQYRGQNLGLKLVTAAVEMARKNNIKIMPLCPFAKRVFEKTAKFSDVLW